MFGRGLEESQLKGTAAATAATQASDLGGRGVEESQIKGTAATQAPKSKRQIGDNIFSKEQVVE